MITSARTWSSWAGLWLLPALAVAADVQVAGSLGIGHSDNIRRVSSNTEDESIAQAGLELAASEQTRRFDGDFISDLAYMDYLHHTYSSEVIGSARGNAAVALIEDHLQWAVSDNFGQTQTDLFTPVTPANSENVNYFTTGPDLKLRLAPTTEMRLGARYSLVNYETSPYDSDRASGTLALVRNLAARSSVSLNAEHDHVEFADQTANTDFDNDALYLAYDAEGGRTKITINVGVNRIKSSGAKENESLLRVNLSRQLTARSALDFSIGRELTDVGTSFGSQKISDNVSLNAQSLASSSSPYLNEFVSIGWNATGKRTRIGATVHYNQENYLQQSLQDRDHTDVQAYVSRDLGPRLSARLVGNYMKDDFKQQGGDSDEKSIACGFSYLASRLFRIDLSVERYDRNSESVNSDYRENRAWLKLRFGEAFVRHVGPFGSTGGPT